MIIIQRICGETFPKLETILDGETLLRISEQVQSVYLDPKLMQYIVDLIVATRQPNRFGILYGSSPRGSLALANASKALALMNGRTYVTPADLQKLTHDCLRHRIILSYEGIAQNLTPDKLLDSIFETVPTPVLTGV